MNAGPSLPGWVHPGLEELRDAFFLSVDMAERGSREAAGISAVLQWLLGASAAPVTGRRDGVHRRDVAVVELCAAEHLVDDGPAPPLHEVCQHFEVAYVAPLSVDVGFGRGAWLGLRWALGEASRPPTDLPIRRADGSLASEAEICARLVAAGKDPTAARDAAASLVQGSRWLASVIEEVAARLSARAGESQ